MKKAYLNPEAMIIEIASEDIVRTSGNVLSIIDVADDGYHDCKSLGDMQWS